MPVVILCFVLFFGVAQLYPVLQGVGLPVPTVLLAGFLMAIASNYNKPAGLPWRSQTAKPQEPATKQPPALLQNQSAIAETPLPESTPSAPQRSSKPHLPEFDLRPRSSISFTIRKSKQRRQA